MKTAFAVIIYFFAIGFIISKLFGLLSSNESGLINQLINKYLRNSDK